MHRCETVTYKSVTHHIHEIEIDQWGVGILGEAFALEDLKCLLPRLEGGGAAFGLNGQGLAHAANVDNGLAMRNRRWRLVGVVQHHTGWAGGPKGKM